ncbi:CDP-glycerol glycerophosphotransferase family protein [Virgibacillus sp. SK37]|uniref:CDP-glycerol glycerophosphotransferase family protein n=1 Tax=Virgibacillus sp. SK37 TaxID=403957 RepID=UPI0011A9FADB|nr:CDP-glycerol glycerophosphotransferase family protein [Virgibacillus sp. SK37]
MFVSSIDNKSIPIRNEEKVNSKITSLTLNGPFIEMEGYASVEGLNSYSEDRIRKTLLFVPEIDVKKIRNIDSENQDLSDEDIIENNTIEIPLDNLKLEELEKYKEVQSINLNRESLAGFRGEIDLSKIVNNKPLLQGDYNIFIRLEQLPNDSDNFKYEKVLPLPNVKGLLKDSFQATKLEYFSAKKVLKYNLIISFNTLKKTLHFKNTLLQSYNPKQMELKGEKQENKYVKSLKRRIFRVLYMLFCLLPINKKKVVFASDSRTELNGNFYFVYEEIYKRNLDLDIKFLFNERIENRKTLKDLIATAYHFATSKIILLDDFYPLIYPLKIRENADLIQVWHAAGAFKTFGYSRIGRPGGPSPTSKNHRNYTKVAVSSEGVRKHYAEGFGVDLDKVYATGVPRSDIFFDDEYKDYVRTKLHEKYPFLKDKKVILFAPTFRGNGQSSAYYPFEVLNLKKLYEDLHDEYVFLFKIHPFVKNSFSIPYEYADFFYDLSDYREVNDLLLITDILITDYSSVCFEFALLNKPMLFFAFDVESYIQDRDFYYNFFDFIPGPLLKNTNELIKAIKEEDFQLEKIDPFVKYFFDDTLGHASANVVDELIIPSIEKVVEEKEKGTFQPPSSRIELFERTIHDVE